MGGNKGGRALCKWLLGACALLTANLAHGQTYEATPSDYSTHSPDRIETPENGDARFRSLFRSWVAVESMADTNTGTVPAPPTASSVAPSYSRPQPPVYSPPVYLVPPPAPASLPRYGCSESGSCYGEISPATGKPKTVYVPGYFRSDGKYVRGYYRSQ